jgi:uncharacterized protein YbjQ (UPF0145 family)
MKHGVLLSTTSSLEGWRVDEYLGPVSAQFVIGTGLFTDYFASWTDLFGAHSRSYQEKLDRINTEALEMIAEKAHRMRANVVLGLRVDHDEISGSGKSMLMVTASGTAARAVNSNARRPAEPSNGVLSATRYRAFRARQDIIRKAHDGSLDWFDNDVWRSVLDYQVHEVADAFLKYVDARMIVARPEDEDELAMRVADYFTSLSHEQAVPLLYRALGYAQPIAKRALHVLKELEGFEPDIIRTMLRDSGALLARARSISAVECDMAYYHADDRARISALLNALSNAFHEAELHEEKGVIHKRRVWTCANGHVVNAKDDCCSVCTADRRGFEHGFLSPEQAAEELRRKLSLLHEHFAPV